MTDNLVLVDGEDNPVGFAEKTQCHQKSGMLHRAFTALLFDDDGRLLLTRRSPSKMLWPGKWDGTVASHPAQGESFVSSAERRLSEELGINRPLEYLFKFEYHVSDGDRGSENEVCGTLIGTVGSQPLQPDPAEITETRLVGALEMDRADPMSYCPWMLLALALLPEARVPGRYNIGPWMSPEITSMLLDMASCHLPQDQWRLVR